MGRMGRCRRPRGTIEVLSRTAGPFLTPLVPHHISVPPSLDKGTPGQSRAAKPRVYAVHAPSDVEPARPHETHRGRAAGGTTGAFVRHVPDTPSPDPRPVEVPVPAPTPTPLSPHWSYSGVWLLAATAALGVALACEDSRETTAPGATMSIAPAADVDAPAPSEAVTPAGTLALPINQSASSSGVLFGITQTGSGPNGAFKINNSGNTQNALLGQSNGSGNAVRGLSTGTGRAGSFEILNTASGQDALIGKTNGTGNAVHGVASGNGTAGKFETTSSSNGSNALYASAAGAGNTISAVNTGSGPAGLFVTTSTTASNPALFAQSAGGGYAVRGVSTGSGRAGYFENTSSSNGVAAVFGRQQGIGVSANFVINNPNNFSDAAYIYTDGRGWAGHFIGSGPNAKGVLVETQGGAGLQVTGGTKNAVVGTTTGARALYTEESSEVWFTDYGFGRLNHGRARILIDPTFAQTINSDEPYHVFVQPYGNVELYVSERTPLGFVVQLREGDPSAEFSYRLVAKRRGFEARRLERAPWADHAAGVIAANH